MVRVDKKTGNLIVEIKSEGMDALSNLQICKEAIYDALVEHNSKEFIGNQDMVYGLVLLLQSLDPSTEQWEQILSA